MRNHVYQSSGFRRGGSSSGVGDEGDEGVLFVIGLTSALSRVLVKRLCPTVIYSTEYKKADCRGSLVKQSPYNGGDHRLWHK